MDSLGKTRVVRVGSTELNGLGSTDRIKLPEVTEMGGRELGDITAKFTFASAPSSGSMKIYAVWTVTVDGASVTVDGDASVAPQEDLLIAELVIRATDTVQVLGAKRCELPVASRWHPVVYNGAGVALAASGNWMVIQGHVNP